MIDAFVPWFGSKRTEAVDIVLQLGPHKFFLDPFCGSCAVLLHKPPSRTELISDLHGDLINLAMVLASNHYTDLYERLRRVLFTEPMLLEANRQVSVPLEGTLLGVPASPDTVGVEHLMRAYWYFVSSWFGRNGMAGTTKARSTMCIRFTCGGGDPATRARSAVASIPDWHERLRRPTICRRDGFKLLERVKDVAGLAIYVDPPYLKKGARYLHDFDPAKHERLAVVLTRFQHARVVVSYYDDQKLLRLYPPRRGNRGWTKISKPMTKNLAAQSQRDGSNRVVAPEVLLINGPVFK
jgi:DNA adenine methylase